MRYNNPKELCGVWSHGIAHNYYGHSHDMRLVFLPDSRAAYCHDGWGRYQLNTFYWHVTPQRQIQFLGVQINGPFGYFPKQVETFEISRNSNLGLRKLTVDVLDFDYYLVCPDLQLAEEYLEPDELGCCGHSEIELPQTVDRGITNG